MSNKLWSSGLADSQVEWSKKQNTLCKEMARIIKVWSQYTLGWNNIGSKLKSQSFIFEIIAFACVKRRVSANYAREHANCLYVILECLSKISKAEIVFDNNTVTIKFNHNQRTPLIYNPVDPTSLNLCNDTPSNVWKLIEQAACQSLRTLKSHGSLSRRLMLLDLFLPPEELVQRVLQQELVFQKLKNGWCKRMYSLNPKWIQAALNASVYTLSCKSDRIKALFIGVNGKKFYDKVSQDTIVATIGQIYHPMLYVASDGASMLKLVQTWTQQLFGQGVTSNTRPRKDIVILVTAANGDVLAITFELK